MQALVKVVFHDFISRYSFGCFYDECPNSHVWQAMGSKSRYACFAFCMLLLNNRELFQYRRSSVSEQS